MDLMTCWTLLKEEQANFKDSNRHHPEGKPEILKCVTRLTPSFSPSVLTFLLPPSFLYSFLPPFLFSFLPSFLELAAVHWTTEVKNILPTCKQKQK